MSAGGQRRSEAGSFWPCYPPCLSRRPAAATRQNGRVGYVIDADTFRIKGGPKIRIADIDAAETRRGRAKCDTEIAIGKDQARAAKRLLLGRRVSYQVTGRNRDRLVARVWLHGRDLGDRLIAEGLARPWLRRHPKPDWCADKR